MVDGTAQFLTERNAALRSLDPTKVQAFHAKWNPDLSPMRDEIAPIAMHKARVECMALTEAERGQSREWLRERGFKTFNGEEP